MEGEDPEAAIADALSGARWESAATSALRAYGPEIFRLLFALQPREDLAEDSFSEFTERLWSSLPTFAGRCSMRTWCYLLARQAAHAVGERARRHEARERHLGDAISNVAEEIRTATRPWLKTDARSAIHALRQELPADDQLLLVLRVERRLAWNDIAFVLAPEDDVRTAAARLRKRFQVIKDQLRAVGRARGLLRDE